MQSVRLATYIGWSYGPGAVIGCRDETETEMTAHATGPDAVASTESSSPRQASRLAVVTLAMSMLLSTLGISAANVALPTLAEVFDGSFPAVQWVVVSYLLAMTIAVVSAGKLGDGLGRRTVLLAGIALFTAGSGLSAAAPSLWVLIAARAVQGLGAAALMALSVALVRDTVPKARTGSAMGLLGTTSAVGTALGPSLGGVLIDTVGWRAIFLVLAVLGLLTAALATRGLPPDPRMPRPDRQGFDIPGTLLLGGTLAAYALAVTAGPDRSTGLTGALLAATALGLALFVFTQARSRAPLIRPAAFRDPVLSGALAMNVLVATVMMATLVVGPFYLARALGLPGAIVGAAMSVGPAVAALSGVPAGRLVDRFGAPATLILGLSVMVAGTLGIAVLPGLAGVAGYIGAIAILTPGYQLFLAANNTVVMLDVAETQRGVVSGLLNLSRNLGLITGASAMGAVFAVATANDITAAPPDAIAFGMQSTFLVAAGLVVVALVIAVGGRVVAARRD